jgi:hypothetical protein
VGRMSEGDFDVAAQFDAAAQGAGQQRARPERPEDVAAAGRDFVRRVREAGIPPKLVAVHAGYQTTGWRRRKNPIHRMVNGWTARSPFSSKYVHDPAGSHATLPGVYVLVDGSVLVGGVDESGPVIASDDLKNSYLGADEIVHALEAFLAEHNA